MKIISAYEMYRINQGLREHMLRVGAAAQQICESLSVDVPTKHILDGCLLHDMGNLLKSDLVVAAFNSFKQFYEPEGMAYWQQVKDEMIAQYGENEDIAARMIVTEMGLCEESFIYFDAFGLEETERIHATGNLGEKIASYCDMRVGPHGIISLAERTDDIRDRYLDGDEPESEHAKAISRRERLLEEIETEIFSYASIEPSDITDVSTKQLQQDLLGWKVSLK